MVMGFPAVYSSNQGREFANGIVKQLVEKTKASQRISTAYHPQTNGLVERYNKTIQSMILKTCSPEQDD
jgi:transposase InsO family protein